MKAIACLIIFLTNLSTCNSQHIKDIYIPKITNETEYFDPNNFSFGMKRVELKNINDIGAKHIAMQAKKYHEADEKGNIIVNYSKDEDGSIQGYIFPYNLVVGFRKVFYKSGNIKTKGIFCWFGFEIGLWYDFDDNGKLISTIDKDKGYTFGWKDVFAFCKKNEISLEKIGDGKTTRITRYINQEKKHCWKIDYLNKYTQGERTIIILDGENGEVLNKIEEEWLPHIRLDED